MTKRKRHNSSLDGVYTPAAKGIETLDTLIPNSMDKGMRTALERLNNALGGDVAGFVCTRLKNTREQLAQYLRLNRWIPSHWQSTASKLVTRQWSAVTRLAWAKAVRQQASSDTPRRMAICRYSSPKRKTSSPISTAMPRTQALHITNRSSLTQTARSMTTTSASTRHQGRRNTRRSMSLCRMPK